MIQAGLLAALSLMVPVVGPAHAEWVNSHAAIADATEDLRHAQSLYKSLRDRIIEQFETGPREAARGDVIRPPYSDIDPKMMVVPPKRGTMRVIPPPDAPHGNPHIEPK